MRSKSPFVALTALRASPPATTLGFTTSFHGFTSTTACRSMTAIPDRSHFPMTATPNQRWTRLRKPFASRRASSLSRVFFLALILAAIAAATADAGRVKEALLDGVPVYHWTNFKSVYPDDIARALVLRDFQRQGFHLPGHFVKEALQNTIDKEYGGDKNRLVEELKRYGETMATYHQFTAEEIILQAMRKRETEWPGSGHPPIPEMKWLASLRKGSRIQMIKTRTR